MQPGLSQAIELANASRKNVEAYREFLRMTKKEKKPILSAKDFFELPITDKKNYIHTTQSFNLFKKNSFPSLTYSSSGSSGEPTFWSRNDMQNVAGGNIHKVIFTDGFGIKKSDPTLVIICFSMGVWIAGNYTLTSCCWVSNQGYQLTSITPGTEKHDIFSILKRLAPKFKKVVLVGYPSFIMDILQETKIQKIPLPHNLKIITSGDSFSESWRDAAVKILGATSTPYDIVSIYGSADAAAIGFETPLTISLRRKTFTHPDFSKALFGTFEKQPSLFQYLPRFTYIESVNQELLLTTQNTIPLVRYNIHDFGQILSSQEMQKLVAKNNISLQPLHHTISNLNLPFIIKQGRSDVAVTFYGLNIYPEHIEGALNKHFTRGMISGNYRAYNTYTNEAKERLCFEIEMTEKYNPTGNTAEEISQTIVEYLKKVNAEFRKLHGIIGAQAFPKIIITPKLRTTIKTTSPSLLNVKGKKPKIEKVQ